MYAEIRREIQRLNDRYLFIMSTAAVEKSDDTMQRCANCGVAEGDEIKLKKCTACYLVQYCGVKCQKDHRPKHKKECKKRAAELKDENLFKQPESNHLGDCPICCLPLPIDVTKSGLYTCCGKRICTGCSYANGKREREARLKHNCPFCRKTQPSTYEEAIEQAMKRVEANDPFATGQMGTERCKIGDYKTGFEYLTKAASLGDVESHFQLSRMYREGVGVEKDEKKHLYHAEKAAIGGHPEARHNLACVEGRQGRLERAVKHYIIAAKLGCDPSMGGLKNLYRDGLVSKDDFEAALRGYQTSIAAMKSPQREEANNLRDWRMGV